MTSNLKIDRARRNVLKAFGLAAGVIVATASTKKRAAAHDDWHGGGGGGCFARGTQILTSDGYCPIESLRVGDEVSARFAGFALISEIESFTISHAAGEWSGATRPVRVKRGALGDNLPTVDLCMTASHAIYVDGVLVPIGDLVNGTSIVFESAKDHDSIDFFHIGLAQHDVLDAAGAPCESLRRPSAEPCVMLIGFCGGHSELRSRLRSAASPVIDRRQPIDIIRDTLEERSLQLARTA